MLGKRKREQEGVSLDQFWSMAGACGAEHPHLPGVVCVRDAGHPGVYPGRHRFWWKVGEGMFEALEWAVRAKAGQVRSKLPSPRPAPARSSGATERWRGKA